MEMSYWCESCARKSNCYTIRNRPKCFIAITNSERIAEQTEPQTYVINPQEPTNDEKCFKCDDFFTCGGQCNKIEDEPQAERLKQFRVDLEYHTDTTHFGKTKGESVTTNKIEDEPQADCAWK